MAAARVRTPPQRVGFCHFVRYGRDPIVTSPLGIDVFARLARLATAIPSVVLIVGAATACGFFEGSEGPDETAARATPKPSTNGIDRLSPIELLETASRNLEMQPAFRVRGNTTNGALDLVFVKGVGSTGTVSTGGHPLMVLATGGKVWVKGDAAYYEAAVGQGSAQLIGDKWVELPPAAIPKIAVFTDGATFLSNMIDTHAEATLTQLQELDGSPVIGAQDTDGGGTLWVAAQGVALPLRFDERGAAGDNGVLRFVDYGVAVPIAAPAPEQVALVPPPPAAPAP
jgi:hypothetical protein